MIPSTSLQLPQPTTGPTAAQTSQFANARRAVRAETPVAVDPPAAPAVAANVGDRKSAAPGRNDALPPGPTPTFQENVLQRIARTALEAQAGQAKTEPGPNPRPELPASASDQATAARSKPLPLAAEAASDRAKSLRMAPVDEIAVSDPGELSDVATPDPLPDVSVPAPVIGLETNASTRDNLASADAIIAAVPAREAAAAAATEYASLQPPKASSIDVKG